MKKALVVVSFGTTFQETREKDLQAVEQALCKAFPDRNFYRAYTSNIVRKRLLEKEQLSIADLSTVLQELQADGYQDVLIQPTHLAMGEEYAKKIMAVSHAFKSSFAKLSVGRPLLADEFDYNLAAAALATQLPELAADEILVLMGHGSPHMHNPAYNILEKRLNSAGIACVIGLVEENDHPNFAEMLALLRSKKGKSVLLMPLLLVCGDHAINDMAGEDENSWANLLKQQGYEVNTLVCGLGRNIAIQNIYVMHALAALAY